MKWIKKKLRYWLGIKYNKDQIHYLIDLFRERTEYHIDVHQYTPSQIIIIGKYGKRDFIKSYQINDKNLKELIDHCKHLEIDTRKGRIDSYPTFSAVLDHELGVF